MAHLGVEHLHMCTKTECQGCTWAQEYMRVYKEKQEETQHEWEEKKNAFEQK